MAADISTKFRAAIMIAAPMTGLAVYLLPIPTGLSPLAQRVLAVMACTIVLWAFQPIGNGIASVLMMALLIVAGVKPASALSGFSAPSFWVLLTVLFYGFAMKKTGLAERISYYILSLFPCSYSGILSAFFVIGFVLALGIPSMTVRTAIMVPIAWALVQALGLPKKSRGSALIVLTTVEMAVVPGLAFLYGALSGPVVQASFQAKHLPLTWGSYAGALTFPTVLLCILILTANRLVMRPEKPLFASPSFVRERLANLGPLRRDEMITALVVLLSIGFWTTDRFHHLPSFLIGMVAMTIFALGGIFNESDIGNGVSWPLLLFLGGVFGLANVIQEEKITGWLAQFFAAVTSHFATNTIGLLVAVAIGMFLLRFLDPSSFIAISVLFLSLVDATTGAGTPPLVLMAVVLLASVPFWLPYQNFWLAMSEGLTSGEAYTAGQRLRLATAYALAVLVSVVFSAGYWKLSGVIR